MPYYATEFESPLSPPEVRDRLRRLVWTKGFWESLFITNDERKRWPYKGRVDDGTFSLSPFPPRRSFSHVMRGTFVMNGIGGTHIRLRITTSLGEALFDVIWFGGVGSWLIKVWRGDMPYDETSMIFTAVFVLAAIAIIPTFFWKAVRSRNELMRRLDLR